MAKLFDFDKKGMPQVVLKNSFQTDLSKVGPVVDTKNVSTENLREVFNSAEVKTEATVTADVKENIDWTTPFDEKSKTIDDLKNCKE